MLIRIPLYCLLLMFIPFGNILFAQDKHLDNQDMLIKSIYFGGGSYFVDQEQENELEIFIKAVEGLENYEVIIFSHTDNIGGKEYNEWLSQMRSTAVYEIVIDIPVPEKQIRIRDFGMKNPLYTNKNNIGRRANRRVDVILVPIVF
ncbi:MAG: OmpA family protein [Candidatus Cyclobacteriaceae bacterium M2_1C_046]